MGQKGLAVALSIACLCNTVAIVVLWYNIGKLHEFQKIEAELVLKLAGKVYLGEDIDVKIK